jgi:hypothetical protein
MSTQSQIDLGDRVTRECERIEAMDSPFPDDPDSYYPTKLEATDIEATIGFDGQLKSITMVVQPSSPRLEFDVTNGTVTGYRDGERHSAPVFGDGEDIARQLHEHLRQLIAGREVDV